MFLEILHLLTMSGFGWTASWTAKGLRWGAKEKSWVSLYNGGEEREAFTRAGMEVAAAPLPGGRLLFTFTRLTSAKMNSTTQILGFYLPSEEDLLELNSFFVTWGFNLVRMRFLRKSQSSVEIIETFIRMRKRNTCNGSRSILWGSRLVTVVEYCYQNSNTVTTKRSGVTRHTSRPTVSLIRGSMNRNYIMALLLSFNTNPVQRSTVVVIYLDLYTRHCIVILIYIY